MSEAPHITNNNAIDNNTNNPPHLTKNQEIETKSNPNNIWLHSLSYKQKITIEKKQKKMQRKQQINSTQEIIKKKLEQSVKDDHVQGMPKTTNKELNNKAEIPALA
jgi:hypothetical protein